MNGPPLRRILTGGRIPSREQELRQKVREAEQLVRDHPCHDSEIQLTLARREYREHLERQERG